MVLELRAGLLCTFHSQNYYEVRIKILYFCRQVRFLFSPSGFFCKCGQESLVLGFDLVKILRTYFPSPRATNDSKYRKFKFSAIYTVCDAVGGDC